MANQEYAEKLKDPRWQQKRLRIMERDEWTCQMCEAQENTLHVHHKIYEQGKDPWDYEDNTLTTLCDNCHELESNSIKQSTDVLLKQVKKKFFSDDIQRIAFGFEHLQIIIAPEVTASIIQFALSNKDVMDTLLTYMLKKDNGVKNISLGVILNA